MNRQLLAVVIAVIGCAAEGWARQAEMGISGMTDTTSPASTATFNGVRTKRVCFTAHNGPDPIPVPVTGTLFHHGAYTPDTSVILAVHGLTSVRSFWDGGPLGPRAGSMARDLARAGYVVITYDRIGYGESPYHRPEGSGYAVTLDNALGALREIVTQIKAGTYTETKGTCAAGAGTPARFGSRDIVLAGHSAGGYLVASYAGLYRDVRGIIPIGASTQGPSNEFGGTVFVPWILPQTAADDYAMFFPPHESGVSPECVRFFFNVPGERSDVVCANENRVPTPSGEFASIVPFTHETALRIRQIGPQTPALIIFSDHDRIFKGPEEADSNDPDHQTPEIEYWRQNCGCPVSSFTQTDSGHAFMFEENVSQTSRAIAAWMRSIGL